MEIINDNEKTRPNCYAPGMSSPNIVLNNISYPERTMSTKQMYPCQKYFQKQCRPSKR